MTRADPAATRHKLGRADGFYMNPIEFLLEHGAIKILGESPIEVMPYGWRGDVFRVRNMAHDGALINAISLVVELMEPILMGKSFDTLHPPDWPRLVKMRYQVSLMTRIKCFGMPSPDPERSFLRMRERVRITYRAIPVYAEEQK